MSYNKLSPQKVQRKKKGECWFYEEKYARDHKYVHKQLLMLDVCEEDEVVEEDKDTILVKLYSIALSECFFHLGHGSTIISLIQD